MIFSNLYFHLPYSQSDLFLIHDRVITGFVTWVIVGNTTGATCEAGTVYLSGPPEFIQGFWWDLCCSIFSFLCSVLQIIVCPIIPFGHLHIVCHSSIYGFWLTLWYIQTLFMAGWNHIMTLSHKLGSTQPLLCQFIVRPK